MTCVSRFDARVGIGAGSFKLDISVGVCAQYLLTCESQPLPLSTT